MVVVGMLNWLFGAPKVGDVIILTAPIYPTVFGAPIPKGTKGVILDEPEFGGHRARFDTGFGTVEADVRGRDFKVHRRAVGVAPFTNTANLRMYIRLGAGIAVVFPFLYYVVVYGVTMGSYDAFLPDLTLAALDGLGNSVIAFVTNPVMFLAGAAIAAIIWWSAFGFPKSRGRTRR